MESKYVTVDGLRTHYLEAGDGSPVVLLHGGEPPGGVSCSHVWHKNIDVLALAHRVIAPDLIGYGQSDNPSTNDGYRVDLMASTLAGLLRQLDIKGATVIGTSRGAFHATYLAMVAPDLVGKLVLTNSASLTPHYAANVVDQHPLVSSGYFKGDAANARHDLEGLNYDPSTVEDECVERVAAMLRMPHRMQAQKDFVRGSSEWDDYRADLQEKKDALLNWIRTDGAFDVPVGIIWGASDVGTTVDDGLALFQLFAETEASVRFLLFDRCGHRPFMERPEEFNSWVLTFTGAIGADDLRLSTA